MSLLMQKQKYKNFRSRLSIALTVALFGFTLVSSPIVLADRFDEKINDLRQQNSQNQQADSLLEYEEQDIQAVIDRLQGDITAAERQIAITSTKRTETKTKIKTAEDELVQQKALMGKNIRAMYVEGDISTVEMLASSKNLSDFIDKEQYRNSLQDKITDTLKEITALKEQLESEKKTLDKLITDQQNIQKQLDGQRSEQKRLLNLNQDQQASYEQTIVANNSKIAELRRQQISENARFTSGTKTNVPDSTGYPWSNAPFPNSISDSWGMYQRQCVSYTAWKVWKSGRHMPYWGGRGNAKQWDDNARAAGIPVDNKPKVGDVAVSNSGYYGHTMYVEAVYDDGTIYISQYNASWDGRYSEARIPIGNLVFIHF